MYLCTGSQADPAKDALRGVHRRGCPLGLSRGRARGCAYRKFVGVPYDVGDPTRVDILVCTHPSVGPTPGPGVPSSEGAC